MKTRHLLRRVLRPPLVLVAAIILIVEDLFWEPLGRAAAWVLARLHLARVEAWIAALPPYPALTLFAVPSVLLFPLKLAALWLMSHGLAVVGVGLLVSAKVGGTAVVARLFTLTRPRLLSIPWFARLHGWAAEVRARAWAFLAGSSLGRAVRAVRARLAALRARLVAGRPSRLGQWWRARRGRARRAQPRAGV